MFEGISNMEEVASYNPYLPDPGLMVKKKPQNNLFSHIIVVPHKGL